MSDSENNPVINKAPGAPGIPGKWTSSAKSGIGKSLSAYSQVTFTTSHGTLNEVYYPREDNACIRDMELLVSDGNGFFSEEKRDTRHETKMFEAGIPAYHISNTCNRSKYKIEKEIITDPLRSTLMQKIRFITLEGNRADYHIYVLLAPHISNMAAGNTAWLGDYKGVPMLYAKRNNITLALACSLPWLKRSVGYVGVSDGYTDIANNGLMQWQYQLADDGNVALTAEVDLGAYGDEFDLALGFGADEYEAAQNAHSSLLEGFEAAKTSYINQWKIWHNTITDSKLSDDLKSNRLFRTRVAVMRMHEADRVPGGIIASMSIPWGYDKGDENIGGYHLVWPRDLVQCSGGFFAFNAHEDSIRVLTYLMATQEADGHWPQNMWLEGKPYWNGLQLDQIAFPVLLMGRCRKENKLSAHLEEQCWQSTKKAIRFLINNGPISPQERWEEESGISVSTLATCIAALLVAANFAEDKNRPDQAQYLRETADYWNSQVENWLYVSGTDISTRLGVDGYYIRINPDGSLAKDFGDKFLSLKNRPESERDVKLNELISVDALALVRFGLRDAKDPKILNTIKVIDDALKVDTPNGPCWRRYVNDGYGEQADGSPYNNTGIGRAWPLLTGERAHYEIAAGNRKGAIELMDAMENFAAHDLLPEQVWDTADIPERDLYLGHHTGSAIPLVWAHAEYVKLCASLHAGRIFDMPDHTMERYIHGNVKSKLDIWRSDLTCHYLNKGNSLRIETREQVQVTWSADGWQTVNKTDCKDSGLGLYFTDLPAKELPGNDVVFTFYYPGKQTWHGTNFNLNIL
jgi:glucoamylase